MTGPLARRLGQSLIVAVVAVAATFLTSAAAHASYGPQDSLVHLQLNGPTGTAVGSVDGSVEFDSGNTMFRYSLTVCRQSSYAAPWLYLYLNGSVNRQLSDGWVYGTSTCADGGPVAVYSAEVPYGSVVTNVMVNLHGSSFSFPGGYKEHQKSIVKDNPYN
jgi:hypothetical protein